jgi:hypothetical protein
MECICGLVSKKSEERKKREKEEAGKVEGPYT